MNPAAPQKRATDTALCTRIRTRSVRQDGETNSLLVAIADRMSVRLNRSAGHRPKTMRERPIAQADAKRTWRFKCGSRVDVRP
jgi:hypothetical protein